MFAPTPNEVALVNQVFQKGDPQKLGIVTGEQGVKIFAGSSLLPATLGDIWALSDPGEALKSFGKRGSHTRERRKQWISYPQRRRNLFAAYWLGSSWRRAFIGTVRERQGDLRVVCAPPLMTPRSRSSCSHRWDPTDTYDQNARPDSSNICNIPPSQPPGPFQISAAVQ